jgi:uncharacterized membrane protein
MWMFLYIVATISLLIYFFKGPNAVWGTATVGLIVGIIIAIFSGFTWLTIIKSMVIGVLLGVAFESLGSISDRMKNKSKKLV